MPSQGFWTGATGLFLHERALDIVAHNISNQNTTSYKASKVHFETLFSEQIRFSSEEAGNLKSQNPVESGLGAALAAVSTDFAQGELQGTLSGTDLAIEGDGFFAVLGDDNSGNEVFFTRDGHLEIDAQNGGGLIRLSSRDGLAILGVNGAIDAATGQFVLPAIPNSTGGLVPIEFSPQSTLAAHQTTAISLARNLDSQMDLAMPGTTMTLNDGSTIRLEFQRAAARGDVFFWRATGTTPNAMGGFDTLLDVNTGATLEGTVAFDAAGAVSGVFTKGDGDGDDFLSAAEVAGLAGWGQDTAVETLTLAAPGADNQTYDLAVPPLAGTLAVTVNGVAWTPVAAFTAAANEYQVNAAGRITFGTAASGDAPPAGADISATYRTGGNLFTLGAAPTTVAGEAGPVVTAPAPFVLAGGAATDLGSVVLTMNGVQLAANVDYTEAAGGVITPLTGWPSGTVFAAYTTNGGAATVSNEPTTITNATPTRSFSLAQTPVAAGTLVVNATRGGVAVVEGTDYTVETATGRVIARTLWDPGAVTADYQTQDTRTIVDFGYANTSPREILFRDLGGGGDDLATGRVLGVDEWRAGSSERVFDALNNEHQITLQFQRLDDNRYLWTATPNLVEALGAANVVDAAGGGGTNLDGLILSPPLAADPNDPTRFQVTIRVDEGAGLKTFTQISTGQAFPVPGAGNYFRVEDPATGEIAFSRDLLTAAGSFAIQADSIGGDFTGTGILSFDADGALDTATLSEPVTFTTSIGTVIPLTLDFTQVTQTASPTNVAGVTQDGFAEGTLQVWRFEADGKILGFYDNGLTQELAQVAVVNFSNPGGLSHANGANRFQETNNSGESTVGASGTNGLGVVRSGFLETSNVDFAEEIANLIIFQRAYQFNSRTITTQDEMLREAINLKR